MEIKPCAHCGGNPYLQKIRVDEIASHPYRVTCSCGISTLFTARAESAVDVWNSRVEQPSEADRWLKEATDQRARAELAEAQRDELSEALEQAKRMLAYAGKIQ